MSVTTDSFTITRTLKACPAHVFAAWSDPSLKRRWFVDHDGPDWKTLYYDLDFRVGGKERGAWRMSATDQTPMAGEHANETTFLEIKDEELIVYAYTMAMNGAIHSASLATVEFMPAGGGTEIRYSESIVLIGESDGIEGRKNGWSWLLDQLETVLTETADA